MIDPFWAIFVVNMGVVLVAFFNYLKSRENGQQLVAVQKDVKTVHEMVDGQRTGMQTVIDGQKALIFQSMADAAPVPVKDAVAVDVKRAEVVAAAVAAAKPDATPVPTAINTDPRVP